MTFKPFTTNALSDLTEVRLYDDTIEKIKAGHPEVPIELPSIAEAVGNAILSPTRIEASYGNSVVFVAEDTTNAAGDPMLVPVKRIPGTQSGRVRSVYFSGNSPGREVLWKKS